MLDKLSFDPELRLMTVAGRPLQLRRRDLDVIAVLREAHGPLVSDELFAAVGERHRTGYVTPRERRASAIRQAREVLCPHRIGLVTARDDTGNPTYELVAQDTGWLRGATWALHPASNDLHLGPRALMLVRRESDLIRCLLSVGGLPVAHADAAAAAGVEREILTKVGNKLKQLFDDHGKTHGLALVRSSTWGHRIDAPAFQADDPFAAAPAGSALRVGLEVVQEDDLAWKRYRVVMPPDVRSGVATLSAASADRPVAFPRLAKIADNADVPAGGERVIEDVIAGVPWRLVLRSETERFVLAATATDPRGLNHEFHAVTRLQRTAVTELQRAAGVVVDRAHVAAALRRLGGAFGRERVSLGARGEIAVLGLLA
jgi:hypothetical protein